MAGTEKQVGKSASVNNTLHSHPYLTPERTFSPQILHTCSLGHLLHIVNTFLLRTYLNFRNTRISKKAVFHLDLHPNQGVR